MATSKLTTRQLQQKIAALESKLSRVEKILSTTTIEREDKDPAVRKNESHYQLFAESTFEAIFFSEKGICTNQNQTAENMFGYTLAEAVGRPGTDWIHPDHREEVYTRMINEITEPYDSVALRKDGSSFPCEIQSRMSNIDGQSIRITALRDISRRIEIEQNLAFSENKFKTLFNCISDAILVHEFVSTEGGPLLEVNRMATELLGYSRSELLQFYPKDFMVPDEYERIVRQNSATKFTESPSLSFETQLVHKDGSIINVEVRGSMMDYEGKKAILSVVRDIRDRLQSEKALVESQRLGAIGEMASSVAHDFNNALHSVIGNTELLLLKHEITEECKPYLESIKKVSVDASDRVKLIQRFGGKCPPPSPFSTVKVTDMINDVIAQSRPLWKDAPEKEGKIITVSVDFLAEKNVIGNGSELRTVLYNLIKNAIEAMPDGGEILLATADVEEGVTILIQDNGLGMDAKTEKRIFQPFFTTKGYETGRGLGLSGAYSILREHGGTISIQETRPGQGTTFELFLPGTLADDSVVHDKKENNKAEQIGNVLWVDDDPMIRQVAEDILDTLNHRGHVAASGFEALEFLKTYTYDLIITDIGMPKMTGWQLAKEIRARYGDAPYVAVVSGWGDQISDDEKKKHGVDFAIAKPVLIQQVEELIDFVLINKCKCRKIASTWTE